MTEFFHAYDLRGKYPEEINEKKAEKVGKAYGTYTEAKEVLVGRDARKHGKKITEAFIEGIRSTGTNVKYAGKTPTPVLYHGMVHKNIKSAAVVTASHNPPEYTGFKFCKEEALAMSREGGMKEIEQIYEEESFKEDKIGKKESVKLKESYIEELKSKINLETELDILINTGNGIAGIIARELFESIGANVEIINEELDGNFPSHLPDPGNAEAQELTLEKMKEHDLAIIFDGDADRAGFILDNGDYIEADKVLALFSEKTLAQEKGKVLYDLRASKLLPEVIRKHDGEPLQTRVGHTFISEKIHQDEEIVFAGELSGHYYFPHYNIPWDDGLFAAVLMTQFISQDGKEIIENYPDYPVSPELRIDCPHSAKQKVVNGMAEAYSNYDISTLDGVKIEFEKGWALIRPSNTEEKMSVRCEADTEEELKQIREDVEGKVRDLIDEFI